MARVTGQRLASSFFALFCALFLACGGDTGDSCRENDDCGGSLICCKRNGTTCVTAVTARGTCQSTCDCSGGDTDAGVGGDDAAVDSGAEDAQVPDAGDAAVDAAAQDAAADASSDAAADATTG